MRLKWIHPGPGLNKASRPIIAQKSQVVQAQTTQYLFNMITEMKHMLIKQIYTPTCFLR